MASPNAIVGNITGIEPPLGGAPTGQSLGGQVYVVHLAGGRRVQLDPADGRSAGLAQILDGLRKLGLPVYLEVHPESHFITRLLIPLLSRVESLQPFGEQAVIVELEHSQATHLLQRANADFEAMEREARAAMASRAPVILTEDDAHHIIDIRLFTPNPGVPLPPFLELRAPVERRPRSLRSLWEWICFWRWCCCLSATRAQQVFNAMSATTCNPLTVPPPCIPFLYPDDGCWARAHEMCRLMIALGLGPQKVWIRGNLDVQTKNNPSCHVRWGWHVAPTLCVRGPGFFQTQRMVIDPSLFTNPITEAAWKGVQGDVNATLTDTDASQYWPSGGTDPAYVDTNFRLAYYRLQLQNRALQFGSPPYANCP